MTMIVKTKPTVYPRKALLKYWLPFPLDTSNRNANATKMPERFKKHQEFYILQLRYFYKNGKEMGTMIDPIRQSPKNKIKMSALCGSYQE